jgi:hypothetical protein
MNSTEENIRQRVDGGETSYASAAEYSLEDVLGQFLALYSGMDFNGELDELGLNRFNTTRRRRIQREFQGLSIALWHLALCKSFPDNADLFFQEFKKKSPVTNSSDSSGEEMRLRIDAYIELMQEKKDTDFLPVAGYLADIVARDNTDMQSLRLKLSLIIRSLYTRIFTKLV